MFLLEVFFIGGFACFWFVLDVPLAAGIGLAVLGAGLFIGCGYFYGLEMNKRKKAEEDAKKNGIEKNKETSAKEDDKSKHNPETKPTLQDQPNATKNTNTKDETTPPKKDETLTNLPETKPISQEQPSSNSSTSSQEGEKQIAPEEENKSNEIPKDLTNNAPVIPSESNAVEVPSGSDVPVTPSGSDAPITPSGSENTPIDKNTQSS